MVLRLDRDEARRIAVRAQLLDARRPTRFLDMVEHLTLLQLDPTAAIAPSADLVSWSRLGDDYRPEQLRTALDEDRTLFEHNGQDDPVYPAVAVVRPMSDLKLFLAEMAQPSPWERTRVWLEANESFRRDVLARLREAGPLLSRDIPDTSAVPWESTGWTGNRNVTRMLELLMRRGEIAAAGRVGRQRTWDLAERIYPAGVEAIPLDEARRSRDERRLAALGIARAAMVGEAGLQARVDGSALEWRVHPDSVGRSFRGRTALLSPFDRLVHDRVRAREIFEYEYILEMYKPAAARRWGYFALPVLHGDRLVGKLDARADRKAGLLVVDAVHEDAPFDEETHEAVPVEIEALARWLSLGVRWAG